jgi:hypothetical protein
MDGLEDSNYNKKHWRLFEMPKICREEVVAYLKRGECNSDVEIRGCFVQIIPYKKEVQSGQGQNRKIGPSTVALFLVERQGQEQSDRANMEDNGTHGSKIVEGEF